MNGQRAGKDNIMTNTTSSSTTKTASTSKKFAFTYNHITKKIVGTDINFQKAGIPGSALEKELLARMAGQPTYTFEVIATEKKPAKRSYEGLTMDLMEGYLAIYEGELAEEMRAEFAKMKTEKEEKKMAFATIKSWFLDQFPRFNVNKAKLAIKAKKLENAKAAHKVIKVSVGVAQSANK